jgi:hypothetical protein
MIAIDANLPGILGVMVPIVAIVGGLSFAFASRYLKSKERMEMISRGMDVSAFKDHDLTQAIAMANSRRKSPLRGGFIFLGVGLGLLLSYWLCHNVFTGEDNEVIYFGVVALFVGVGIILSHLLDKKGPDNTPNA